MLSLCLICASLDIFVFNVVAERGKASLSLDQSERAQYATCWVGCLDLDLRLEAWRGEEDRLSTTSALESQGWCVGGVEGR